MGFTLATHYCAGHAVETKLAMGEPNVGCGMEDDAEPCGEPMLMNKSCCEDQYLSLSIEEEYNSTSVTLEFSPTFLFSFAYTFFQVLPSVDSESHFTADFPPPLYKQSLQVLFQTFLI